MYSGLEKKNIPRDYVDSKGNAIDAVIRRSFEVSQRLKWYEEWKDSKEKLTPWCKKHNIWPGTLRHVKNKMERLRTAPPKARTTRQPRYPELDAEVRARTKERIDDQELRPEDIRDIAVEVAEELKISPEEFSATEAFWRAHCRRHQLKVKSKLYGERKSADLEAAAKFPPFLKGKMREHGVRLPMVFNLDETLVLTHAVRQVRVVVNAKSASGKPQRRIRAEKQKTNRIGACFWTAANGEFLPFTLISHTAVHPERCTDAELKKIEETGCVYSKSKDGWVKSAALVQGLALIVPWALKRARASGAANSAILIMDNASHHGTMLLELARLGTADDTAAQVSISLNVADVPTSKTYSVASPSPAEAELKRKMVEGGVQVVFRVEGSFFRFYVYFLPPNTTSVIQPLDQGCIARIKTVLDARKHRAKVAKESWGVLQVMKWVMEAQNEYPTAMVRNSWKAVLGE